MSSITVGVLGFVVVLALIMFMKFPVGFSMILVGVAGMAYLTSFDTAVGVLGGQVFASSASYDMAVVAMFILMGELAFVTGVSDKAYEAAFKWLGRLRGGLAMATIGACSAFAAVSGSSPATAATVGSVALPEMKKYGYDDSFATGSVAAGGVLGILIPPSMGFILFGLLTEQSISTLYAAGIVPGILLTLLFMVAAYLVATIRPQGINMPSFSMREKLLSLKGLVEVAIIFIVVIGGLFYGFFTPMIGSILLLGCVMDAIAMIMLTVPVIFPIVSQMGFDPIWFGVLGVLAIEAGLITPPVGMNVYVIAGVAKGVPVHTIFRGIIPFFVAIMVCMVLIMAFPQIALFLPGILK